MQKNNLKFKKVFFGFGVLVMVLVPIRAQAAVFSLAAEVSNIEVGDQFEIRVSLDTEEESLNALAGEIVSDGRLAVTEIFRSDSAVALWVEEPKVTAGQLIFSGVIPGGIRNPDVTILRLLMEAKSEGLAELHFTSVESYRNDGAGTPSDVSSAGLQVIIRPDSDGVNRQIEPPSDTTPPELFTPEIARDQNSFDGKWFVAFAATDKGGGVERYEIKEASFYAWGGKWLPAESPFVLRHQPPRHFTFVRAIDAAGNSRDISVRPVGGIFHFGLGFLWAILILIVLLAFLVRMKRRAWSKL